MSVQPQDQSWTSVIRPASGWFDLHLLDVWRYRDLILLFVYRDFVAVYKQTILGPLWFMLQPLLTTLVFTLVFANFAQIPTDGVPPLLFYLSGVVTWNYFAGCLTKTSGTFINNAHLFGKVYFPRLTVPVATVVSNLIALVIQFALFLAFFAFYAVRGSAFSPQPQLFLLPLLVLQMAALGLGCGIIVSSLTIRYRDLTHLVSFGVQLWMFATPIVYPASQVPVKWQWLVALNPMAPVVDTVRFAFLGAGTFHLGHLLSSIVITIVVLLAGVVLFSRVEKNFMDTV